MTSYGSYTAVLGSGYGSAMAHVHQAHGVDDSLDDARIIYEALPHGSGIDYTWHVMQLKTKPRRFHCYNRYHAMDEWGGYCDIYDFVAIVDILDTGGLQLHNLTFTWGSREYSCCGYGLKEYLGELLAEVLEEYSKTFMLS